MPRMNILNTVEREAFNSPPVFSSFQRKQYFDFPSKLRRFAAGLRNPAYQLGFLLSASYFKAARRFFSPGSFHPRDIEYVARQPEPGAPTVDFAQCHPRARQRHQHTIRTIYGFRACDSAASRLLLKEIAGLVRSQVKPKVIFWRWIRSEVIESGHGSLDEGHWSAATEGQRASAIEHLGSRRLLIRFSELAGLDRQKHDTLDAWLERAQKGRERMAVDEEYRKEVARGIS